LRPFDPLLRNPHWQTIAGHYWPRPFDAVRYPVERRLYRTEPEVQVLVEIQRPQGAARGELVMVHGLEGSGEAGYMRSLSHAGLAAGFGVHRFHMRTCGGTEHLCPTLYHSGLTSDLLAVLREMQREGRAPVWLVGFSLGGNVVLKLAGELGHDAQPLISGVCAASVPIDLAACARRIGRRDNRVYEQRFLRRMRARLCATGRYRQADFAGVRSIFEMDDRITAPSFGFRGARHYYSTQSSNQFLESVRVPTLIVQAKDDTFIPFEVFDHAALRENPWVRLLTTEYGGHLGFIARQRPRLWLDGTVIEWVLEHSGTIRDPLPSSQEAP
jgi:hypothetical protein